MKTKLSFILFFAFLFCSSQEITDDEKFKKCRKEFSKKICLSDEDKDSVLFYLDECPKIFGVAENNGCAWTDKDNDGVFDKDDACPDVSGPEENHGCPWPDTDGDGILDKDDKCPTIAGQKEYEGCDCLRIYNSELERVKKIKEESKNINYKILADRIIQDIDLSQLKENNIIFLTDFTEIGYGNTSGYSCPSSYDATPVYKNSDFWTPESIMKIFKKINKNFVLGTVYGELTFEDIPQPLSTINMDSKKVKIIYKGSQTEVSLYYKSENDSTIVKKYNTLLIKINKNNLDNKIDVEMCYSALDYTNKNTTKIFWENVL